MTSTVGAVCHVMLDIETLGTRPGFIVLSAALVRFDDLASTSLALDTVEQSMIGLERDPSTEAWWAEQSPQAKQSTFANPVPLRPALDHIAAWLAWARGDRPLFLWCHGAAFDASMLGEVYRRAGIPAPWSFRDVRDTRTLYDLAGVDIRAPQYATGTDHVALDDAIGQTKAAIDALRILAGRVAPEVAA